MNVTFYNNTFEENGSHNQGVLYIYRMTNVNILNDNVFKGNTDELDLKNEVIS